MVTVGGMSGAAGGAVNGMRLLSDGDAADVATCLLCDSTAHDGLRCLLCDKPATDGACLLCEDAVGDRQLQCYDCGRWAHRLCAGLSPQEWKVLTTIEGGLHWVCAFCLSAQTGTRCRAKVQLEHLTSLLKALSDRIDTLERGQGVKGQGVNGQGVKELLDRIEALEGGQGQAPTGLGQQTEEKLTEEKPAEEKPTEEKLTEENPAEDKLTEENPAEENPAEEKLTEEKLSEEKLTEENAVEEKLTEEKLTEENPAEEKLTEEKLTEENPAEEKPTEEKLTEEKPAEEKPTEEKQTKEIPPEEKAAEEKWTEDKQMEEKTAELKLTEAQGGTVHEENTPCSGIPGDTAETRGNYPAKTGGNDSAETGGNDSAETGGNDSAETGGNDSAETGGNDSAETGGNDSAETGGNDSAETGGDDSAETGGDDLVDRREVREEEVMELAEEKCPALQLEPVADLVCVTQSSDTESSDGAFLQYNRTQPPSVGTFLQYSRTQLLQLQVKPAPLTPKVISCLHFLGISVDSPVKQNRRTKTDHWQKLKWDDQLTVSQSPHQEPSDLQCSRTEPYSLQCSHTEPSYLQYSHTESSDVQCSRTGPSDLQYGHNQQPALEYTYTEASDLQSSCSQSPDLQNSCTEPSDLQYNSTEASAGTFLQYSRTQLLQVKPAPLTPEVTSLLCSLGISVKQNRRTKTDHRQKLKVTDDRQTELSAMPGRGVERGGNYSCFLCGAEGFTALGMQHHLSLCPREVMGDQGKVTGGQGEVTGGQVDEFSCPFCPFSSSSVDFCQAHITAEHLQQLHASSRSPGETDSRRGPSPPQPIGELSTAVDNIDAMRDGSWQMAGELSTVVDDIDDGPHILGSSLRLNDCPGQEGSPRLYDDVINQNDDGVHGDVAADDVGMEEGGGEEDREKEGGGREPSNLSVILGSLESSVPLQQREAVTSQTDIGSGGSVTHPHPHPGGARPKVRPTPTPPSGPTHTVTSQQINTSPWGGREERGGWDMRGDQDPAFSCPFCDFCTASEGEIHIHVNQQHLVEEGVEGWGEATFLYSCPFCAQGFDSPRDLSFHVNTHHPDGPPVAGPSSHWGLPGPSEGQGGGRCPVCGVGVGDSEEALAAHVNQHFPSNPQSLVFPPANAEDDHQVAVQVQREEDQQQRDKGTTSTNGQAQYGMGRSMTAGQQFDRDLESAAFKGQITIAEFHAQKNAHALSSRSGVDDGSTRVPGVVERLQQLYDRGGWPRTVRRLQLCSPTHHYSGSFGDRGWGCGYRNLQMLLSCLMANPTYLQVVFNGRTKLPSIGKLQQLIESAWEKGFDVQGRQQLGCTLVDTRKWIGATEVVAFLSSLRVKCELFDFVKPSGPNNTHPALLQWVREYFTSTSPFTPPLYLQHQGHSRTIVGVEELTSGGTGLLIFDPGVPRGRMEQFLQDGVDYRLLPTIRKPLTAFRARQYQVVAVVGVMDEQQHERSKIIHSTRMS